MITEASCCITQWLIGRFGFINLNHNMYNLKNGYYKRKNII